MIETNQIASIFRIAFLGILSVLFFMADFFLHEIVFFVVFGLLAATVINYLLDIAWEKEEVVSTDPA